MKKYKFLIFISILLLIIGIIITIKLLFKEEQKSEELSFGDVIEEISLASNNNFNQISKNDITRYIPINLSYKDNYIFAVDIDNNDEYFLLANNLTKEQQSQIKQLSIQKESVIFYSDENYTYLINSEEYLYMIEGIIKSFISNYEKKKWKKFSCFFILLFII